MKEIKCQKCGKALGFIEKARIMKGIAFLCPAHAGTVEADALRSAAEAFGKNRRAKPEPDFMDLMKEFWGQG